MSLDSNAVREANRELWAKYPELQGRELTREPHDAAYRIEWARLYREARAKKEVASDDTEVQSIDIVESCPECEDGTSCLDSEACKEAQYEDESVRETVNQIRWFVRPFLYRIGCHDALSALDHFLSCSGSFVEIPEAKAAQTRDQRWGIHRSLCETKLKDDHGVRGRLAQKLIKNFAFDPAVSAEQWLGVNNLVVKDAQDRNSSVLLDGIFWEGSGPPNRGLTCDNLTYAGEKIRSDFKIQCSPKGDDALCFKCSVVWWRSYVVDNYDWDGGKAFGLPFLNHVLNKVRPTSDAMLKLTKVGCAKAYQRSSRSWEAAIDIEPWDVCFSGDKDIRESAWQRFLKDRSRVADNKAERRSGALPSPAPAERMQGA